MHDIALIGAGTMGEPMGACLLRAGFALHVCPHRRREPIDRLVSLGAREHATPHDAAAAADAVITMLPDAPEVEEALFGPQGAAGGLRSGAVVIDMSTISPVASKEFHARLGARGIGMLDAPVSGGPARARTGQLTIMVGGDPALVERCLPVLSAMGTPTHVGPPGMGETCKLVNQVIIAGIMLANVEGLVFARRCGADVTVLLRVLSTATASNYLLEKWLPKAWFEDHHRGGFALDLLRKDLRAALSTLPDGPEQLPCTAFAYERYTQASQQGAGDLDYSAVARLYETE
jgi:3-hydroxyisobutyrate dehydrogenase-like beta-hydroxyacid dehydrogenase